MDRAGPDRAGQLLQLRIGLVAGLDPFPAAATRWDAAVQALLAGGPSGDDGR